MLKLLRPLLGVLAALAFTAALANDETPAYTGEKVQVVTTFTVLKDIVSHVAGDRVEIHSMVPMGTDPHEYQPLPRDVVAATQAEVLFWNGLNMETGDGWFRSLVEVAGKAFGGEQVVEMAAGIEPLYLTDGDEMEVNPHAFLSPRAGIIYARNAVAGMQVIDPANADFYAKNGEEFIAKLQEWDKRYEEAIGAFPPEERILITSERAFQYLAADYGLQEGYLWQIDTDEQGTPLQIRSLIEFVRNNSVRGLLVETNVDARPMKIVSEETGVPIVGEVYSDELGPAGSPGETYLKYLEYNLEMIVAGLRGEAP